jgi:hypothetical protein
VAEPEIASISAALTMVGGKIVHETQNGLRMRRTGRCESAPA